MTSSTTGSQAPSWGDVEGRFMSDSLHQHAAEEASRTNEQESQRDHVGEPDLDAAAEERPDVDLGELFRRADDQAADDRAEDRVETSEHEDRQGLEHHER